MSGNERLISTQRIGTGLAFVVFPLVFVFAFAVHPGLLHPRLLDPTELIRRAHGARLLQLAHALVTIDTALLIVVALHFVRILRHGSAAWAGFVGGALAVLGSLALAADKGALCLTMSALDSLSEAEFAGMMPGLVAIFGKGGWLVMLWGIVLLPIGFGIQAISLLVSKSIATHRGVLFLVGVLLIGTPDGLEIVNLTAAVLLSIAFVPYGLELVRGRSGSEGPRERQKLGSRVSATRAPALGLEPEPRSSARSKRDPSAVAERSPIGSEGPRERKTVVQRSLAQTELRLLDSSRSQGASRSAKASSARV